MEFEWQGDNNNNWGNAGNWAQTPGSGDVPNATDHDVLFNNTADRFNVDLQGNSRIVRNFTVAGLSDQTYTFFNGQVRLKNLTVSGFGGVGSTHIFNADLEQRVNGTWSAGSTLRALEINGELSGTADILIDTGSINNYILNNANTYSGTMTLEGVIELGHVNALLSANVVLTQNNGIDVISQGINANIGSLSGTGNLDIGSTTFDVGLNNTSTSFSGDLTGAGNFRHTGTGTFTYGGVFNALGTFTNFGGGQADFIGATGTINDLVASTGSLTVGAGSVIDLGGTGIARSGSTGTLFVDGAGAVLQNGAELAATLGTGEGMIDIRNGGGVQGVDFVTVGKLGTGTLNIQLGGTLNATNLGVGGKDALENGGTGDVAILSGGSATITGSTKLWTTASELSVFGNGTLTTGVLENPDGTNPTIFISAPTTGAALTIGTNDPVGVTTFSGQILDTGAGAMGNLAKVGSNHVILTGNNTFSGGITLNGGTLGLAHNNAAGTGTITVLGSTIDYADGVSIANPIDLQNNVTLNVDTGSATQAGVISETGGSFGVDKTGAGTLVLSANNTFTGGVNHLAGTLNLAHSNAAGAGTINVNGGPVIEIGGFGANVANPILLNNDLDLRALSIATYSGNLSGDAGNHAVDKTGSSTLFVTGSMTADQLRASEGILSVNGATINIVPDVFNALHVRLGAQMNVQAGSQVTIGGGTASNPRVVVTHAGSDLFVGGAGTLLQTSYFDVGPSNDGNPTATILNNAQVDVSGRFSVGDLGANDSVDGTININSGAAVNAFNTVLFDTGTLNIDGGSLVTNTLARTDGTGQTLMISDGAGSALVIGGNGQSSTYDGVIQDAAGGPGSIHKLGNGTLTLGAANTYSGQTIIDGGSVILNDPNALQNSTVVINVDNGLDINDASLNGQATIGALAGSGDLVIGGGGGVLRAGGNGDSTNYSGSLGTTGAGDATLTHAGPGTLSLTGGTAGSPSGVGLLAVEDGEVEVAGSGVLAATTIDVGQTTTPGNEARLGVRGGGLASTDFVFLGSPDGGTGRLQVEGVGSRLDANNAIALGLSYLAPVPNGNGVLEISSDGLVTSHELTFFAATSSVEVDGGSLDVNRLNEDTGVTGQIAISDPSGGAALTVGAADGDSSFHGVITDAGGGPGSLRKLGAGTLTLSGANTFSGGVTINGGTLALNNDSAAGTGPVTVLGSTISYADTVNVANTIDLQNDVTLEVATGTAIQSGVVGETGGGFGITKTGDGMLALNGANTYSGGTHLTQGALRIGNDNALGTGPLTIEEGTTIDRTGSRLVKNDWVINGGFTNASPGSGGFTVDGEVTLNPGVHRIDSGGDSNLTFRGAVSGPGGLIVGNNVELNFSGGVDNTYAGSTTVESGGTLLLSSPAVNVPGDLTVDNGGTLELRSANSLLPTTTLMNNGLVEATGFLQTIGELFGAGTIEVDYFSNYNLTILAGDYSGTIDDIDLGVTRVIKDGPGTLTLGGANTFGRGVNINDGTLLVNNTTGSATGGGRVRVNTGGTFGGTGSVAGNVNVVLGGTFAPGASPGTLTVGGDLDLDAGAALDIEIGGLVAGDDYDRVEVTGFADLLGDLNVTLINSFTPSAGDSFAFLFANAGFNAAFANLNLPDLSGLNLDWQLNPGGSTLFLDVINAVLLEGDLNNDGFVGIADLNIVLGNWNQNVTPADPLLGDPSGDGFVGIADLNIVLGNWNAGTPPTLPGADTNIPEPATLLLCAALLPTLTRRR